MVYSHEPPCRHGRIATPCRRAHSNPRSSAKKRRHGHTRTHTQTQKTGAGDATVQFQFWPFFEETQHATAHPFSRPTTRLGRAARRPDTRLPSSFSLLLPLSFLPLFFLLSLSLLPPLFLQQQPGTAWNSSSLEGSLKQQPETSMCERHHQKNLGLDSRQQLVHCTTTPWSVQYSLPNVSM